MHRLWPGFYFSMALTEDGPATDVQGPFDTIEDAIEFMREYGIEYRPDAPPCGIGIPYHAEMTDGVAGTIWAGKIVYRD